MGSASIPDGLTEAERIEAAADIALRAEWSTSNGKRFYTLSGDEFEEMMLLLGWKALEARPSFHKETD